MDRCFYIQGLQSKNYNVDKLFILPMKTCFLFMILSILTSCAIQKIKGVSLEQALSMAGENRAELEKVRILQK